MIDFKLRSREARMDAMATGQNKVAGNSESTFEEVTIMSQKKPNTDIRCRVTSCAYHCGDQEYCSLNAIQVEPCKDCCTGKAADESMCGSYRCK